MGTSECVYLHYVFDLWADRWRRRHARGDVTLTRFADDYVAGFEHRGDAERFLADLRDRLAKFGLGLAEDKARLSEFGRYAAKRRAARGLSKPETFDFLGFTHICAKTNTQPLLGRRRYTPRMGTVTTRSVEIDTSLLERLRERFPGRSDSDLLESAARIRLGREAIREAQESSGLDDEDSIALGVRTVHESRR